MKNSSAVPLAPSLLVLGLEEEEIFRNRGCFSLIDLDNNNDINMHIVRTLTNGSALEPDPLDSQHFCFQDPDQIGAKYAKKQTKISSF